MTTGMSAPMRIDTSFEDTAVRLGLSVYFGGRAPPRPPPAAPRGRPPVTRWYASVSFQNASPRGDIASKTGPLEKDVPHASVLSDASELEAQLGFRFTERFSMAAYLARGSVDLVGESLDDCQRLGCYYRIASKCAGTTNRRGLLLRVDLLPRGPVNPWLAGGFGLERHRVDSIESRYLGGAGINTHEIELELDGGEIRLAGGMDVRSLRIVGIGVWVGVGVGRYTVADTRQTEYGSEGPRRSLGGDALHAWLTAGVRAILFP